MQLSIEANTVASCHSIMLAVLALVVAVIALFGLLIILYFKGTNPICTSIERLEGKVALVTGGTAGIGVEIAKDLTKRGARVIIAAPFEDEAKQAIDYIIQKTGNTVEFKKLDLASFGNIRKFCEDFLSNEDRLDILINNAGGMFDFITEDGFQATMQVNYLGHFLLTMLLLPLLKRTKSSRIVNVSSLSHPFGTTKISGLSEVAKKNLLYYYKNSKLYTSLFTKKLSKILEGSVIVNTSDPGVVGTGIMSKILPKFINDILVWGCQNINKTPEEGAQTAIHCAVEDLGSGGYYSNCKEVSGSRKLKDQKLIEAVWIESKRLVGLE